MDTVPKVLTVLILAVILIFAVYSLVSGIVGEQGSLVLEEGENLQKGFDCVFSNEETAGEKCLENSQTGEQGENTGGEIGG